MREGDPLLRLMKISASRTRAIPTRLTKVRRPPCPDIDLSILVHLLQKQCLQWPRNICAHVPNALGGQKWSPNALLRFICSKMSSFSTLSHLTQILPSKCDPASHKLSNSFPKSIEALGCFIQRQMVVDLTQRVQKVRSLFIIIISNISNIKLAINYTGHTEIHSEVSTQLGHCQGEAVEPSKCVIFV